MCYMYLFLHTRNTPQGHFRVLCEDNPSWGWSIPELRPPQRHNNICIAMVTFDPILLIDVIQFQIPLMQRGDKNLYFASLHIVQSRVDSILECRRKLPRINISHNTRSPFQVLYSTRVKTHVDLQCTCYELFTCQRVANPRHDRRCHQAHAWNNHSNQRKISWYLTFQRHLAVN